MWVFSMNRECEYRVLVKLYIFLICLLKFTEDYKLQVHLSRNELFGVGPVVHKGVHMFKRTGVQKCEPFPTHSTPLSPK